MIAFATIPDLKHREIFVSLKESPEKNK